MIENPIMSGILRLRIPSGEVDNLRAFCTSRPNSLVIRSVRKTNLQEKLRTGMGDVSEVLLVIFTAIVLTDLGLLIHHTIRKIEAKRIRIQSIRGTIYLTEQQTVDEIECLLRELLSGRVDGTPS
jgi:hypothetical protein